ncbi:MAG: hypothetical protein B7X34_06020 [Acidobacteriia bacterium 12-62-4]|nr:MAG: hypothetical protein B7X34_06020 [Acidobacteriia bacterium 12-62-4]
MQFVTLLLLAANLDPHNVKVEEVTFKGRPCIRLTDTAPPDLAAPERLAILKDSSFTDGVIEFDFAGDRLPTAPDSARGFTGLAFRVGPGGQPYNAFYLRPYNGRSQNQVQRNHSAQYIAIPGYDWSPLREKFPKLYESYVDLVPGEWTKVKIEVRGKTAKLFVNGATQPTLLVNDLLAGNPTGALALWIGPSSQSHFANLRITR